MITPLIKVTRPKYSRICKLYEKVTFLFSFWKNLEFVYICKSSNSRMHTNLFWSKWEQIPVVFCVVDNNDKMFKNSSIFSYTFDTLVSCLALRTHLSPFPPFILITWPANWKTTLFTSHKQISIHCESHSITTYLTELTIQIPHRLRLQHKLVHISPIYTDKLLKF